MQRTLIIPSGWEMNRQWRASDGSVYVVAWAPGGHIFATGSFDNKVRLWTRGGTLKRTLVRHTQPVVELAWSPDGTRLATSSQDELVCIWDAQTGDLVRDLRGHRNYVYAIAWSRDGSVLATGSHDTTIRLWSATDWECLATRQAPDAVESLTAAPHCGGFYAGCRHGTLVLCSLLTTHVDRIAAKVDGTITSLAATPEWLAVGTTSGLVIKDIHSWIDIRHLLTSGRVVQVSLSASGHMLAARAHDGTHVWKVGPWMPLGSFRNTSELPSAALAFHPEDLELLTTGPDGHDVVLMRLDAQILHGSVCRHPMSSGRLCLRPLDGHDQLDTLCAYHTTGTVYTDEQREELVRLILGDGSLASTRDLSGYHVPSLSLRGKTFPHSLSFDGCLFDDDQDFSGTTFVAGVSFKDARFNRGFRLDGASIQGDVVFDGASFKSLSASRTTFAGRVSLTGVTCEDRTDFSGARFAHDVAIEHAWLKGGVSFKEGRFAGGFVCRGSTVGVDGDELAILDLSGATFDHPERVQLRSLNRDPSAVPLKMRLVNCDVERVRFEDIHWPARSGRLCLQDELDLVRHWQTDATPGLVRVAYRTLMKSCDESRAYDWAEECFIATLEIRAADRQTDAISRLVINAYGLASRYGSSYVRATLVLAALVLLVFPSLFLASGGAQLQAGSIPWPPIMADVAGALSCSLETATFVTQGACNPSTLSASIVRTIERIVVPAQAALLLLALRRRFRR